jgi:hypothetical protein
MLFVPTVSGDQSDNRHSSLSSIEPLMLTFYSQQLHNNNRKAPHHKPVFLPWHILQCRLAHRKQEFPDIPSHNPAAPAILT